MLLFFLYGSVLAATLALGASAFAGTGRNNPRRNAYWAAIIGLVAFAFLAFPRPTLYWRLEYVIRGGAIVGALLLLRRGPPQAVARPARREAHSTAAEARDAIVRNSLGALVLIGVITVSALVSLGAKAIVLAPFRHVALTLLVIAIMASPHASLLLRLRGGADPYYLGAGKAVAVTNLLLLTVGLSLPACPYVFCPPAALMLAYSKPTAGVPLLLVVALVLSWQLRVVRSVNRRAVAPEALGDYERGAATATLGQIATPIAIMLLLMVAW